MALLPRCSPDTRTLGAMAVLALTLSLALGPVHEVSWRKPVLGHISEGREQDLKSWLEILQKGGLPFENLRIGPEHISLVGKAPDFPCEIFLLRPGIYPSKDRLPDPLHHRALAPTCLSL